jgi:multicomponent Na+:H+ antiporter subunit G
MLINILIILLFALSANLFQHPMVGTVINLVIIVSLLSGLLFFFATGVGILRFPDFFTRLHAAGKGDTLSTILILFACSLYAINSADYLDKTTILSALKILLIINFIFIGSPTATHALMEAGDNSEIDPWAEEDDIK